MTKNRIISVELQNSIHTPKVKWNDWSIYKKDQIFSVELPNRVYTMYEKVIIISDNGGYPTNDFIFGEQTVDIWLTSPNNWLFPKD